MLEPHPASVRLGVRQNKGKSNQTTTILRTIKIARASFGSYDSKKAAGLPFQAFHMHKHQNFRPSPEGRAIYLELLL